MFLRPKGVWMRFRPWRVGIGVVWLLPTTCALIGDYRDDRTASQGASLSQNSTSLELDDEPRSTNPEGLVGTSGCSARACHGSLTARNSQRVLQNEYTTWMQRDT